MTAVRVSSRHMWLVDAEPQVGRAAAMGESHGVEDACQSAATALMEFAASKGVA